MSKFVQFKNYQHPPRNPAHVPPSEINVWELPQYVPEKHEAGRTEADGHLKFRRLPADVARCPGYSADAEWREGCDDCLRRTSPPVDPERVWMMVPPVLIVFECQARIAP